MPRKRTEDYDLFLFRTNHPYCWACGNDGSSRPRDWYGPFLLERAHLASGSGKMRRVEDRRCVCILCSRCHKLHGRARIKENGVYLPFLSDANLLWLKMKMDPEWWDLEYITELWTGIPPEPEPPCNWGMR